MLGFAPNPTQPSEAAGAGGKPYPPYPYGECCRFQGVKGKCTTSSPLTPLHLRGVAKLTEADGAGNPSRLAKQPRSGLAFYRLEGAHGVGKTLGGRAVGGKCAVGTHFKGFGFTRHRASSV